MDLYNLKEVKNNEEKISKGQLKSNFGSMILVMIIIATIMMSVTFVRDSIAASYQSGDGYSTITMVGDKTYRNYKQYEGSYASDYYWGSTIAGAACGPTSVAIVLSGYKMNYSPKDVVTRMINEVEDCTTSYNLSTLLNLYGIDNDRKSYNGSESISEIRQNLGEGRPVIVGIDGSDGVYSSGGHCMVLLGERDGLLIVSNPGRSDSSTVSATANETLENFLQTQLSNGNGYILIKEELDSNNPIFKDVDILTEFICRNENNLMWEFLYEDGTYDANYVKLCVSEDKKYFYMRPDGFSNLNQITALKDTRNYGFVNVGVSDYYNNEALFKKYGYDLRIFNDYVNQYLTDEISLSEFDTLTQVRVEDLLEIEKEIIKERIDYVDSYLTQYLSEYKFSINQKHALVDIAYQYGNIDGFDLAFKSKYNGDEIDYDGLFSSYRFNEWGSRGENRRLLFKEGRYCYIGSDGQRHEFLDVSNIDKDGPKVEIKTEKTEEINKIKVTITSNEAMKNIDKLGLSNNSNIESYKLSEDEKVLQIIYINNTEEDFEITYNYAVEDFLGNETKIDMKNENITIPTKIFKIKYDDTYQEIKKGQNTYIRNISPSTTIENTLNSISTNGTISIYKGNNKITDKNTKIATGMKVQALYNNKTYDYIIVVNGDSNGDGDVGIKDILAINKHRLGKTLLKNEYELAGDINKDNKIDIKDLLQINKFRLGKIKKL